MKNFELRFCLKEMNGRDKKNMVDTYRKQKAHMNEQLGNITLL